MIQAKMITDSICPRGNRLRTLEVVMPRYILAEFNTHRILSKNSASSRAIPFNKMVQNVQENPFIPYAWQKDHKGMQGTEYIEDTYKLVEGWLTAKDSAIQIAEGLNNSGVTKQLANRLLEPFMYHKVLVSGTEWDNFFNLRCPQYEVTQNFGEEPSKYFKSKRDLLKVIDPETKLGYSEIDWLTINKGQADIHMMFLAEAIWDATNESTPTQLKEGEWHIPYGDNMDEKELMLLKFKTKGESVEDLKLKISISRCARLSYQTLGDNPIIDYEKDLALYENLSTSGHYSPFEHVARVMTNEEYNDFIKGQFECNHSEPGYPDLGDYPDSAKGWCRNFKGFIQYRELLD